MLELGTILKRYSGPGIYYRGALAEVIDPIQSSANTYKVRIITGDKKGKVCYWSLQFCEVHKIPEVKWEV